MKKIALAIALFAFVGSASVQAGVKHEGAKTEKSDKKEKKAKKLKACTPGEGKACCKKKGASAEAAPAQKAQ